MAKEQIIETRLGKRSVDMDKLLHFPQGLVGFEDCHNFTLLQIREDAPFLVLQSTDEPALGLVVADPYSFLTEYTLKVGAAEEAILEKPAKDELAVLVTVSIPPGKPEETALNLTGPILINHRARVGLQVLQNDLSQERFYLNQSQQDAEKEKTPAPAE